MKRFFLISSFSALFALSASAQNKQEVISSAGGYSVKSGLSLSWTLGEALVPTFKSTDGNIVLTHGFQQQLIITAVEETFDVAVKVKVFPNPTADILNIEFESPVDHDITLTLLDSGGRLILRDIISETMVEAHLNLQDVPPGIYYLRLIKGKLINVYKVVKL